MLFSSAAGAEDRAALSTDDPGPGRAAPSTTAGSRSGEVSQRGDPRTCRRAGSSPRTPTRWHAVDPGAKVDLDRLDRQARRGGARRGRQEQGHRPPTSSQTPGCGSSSPAQKSDEPEGRGDREQPPAGTQVSDGQQGHAVLVRRAQAGARASSGKTEAAGQQADRGGRVQGRAGSPTPPPRPRRAPCSSRARRPVRPSRRARTVTIVVSTYSRRPDPDRPPSTPPSPPTRPVARRPRRSDGPVGRLSRGRRPRLARRSGVAQVGACRRTPAW